jgi:hypothetical protein
VTKKEQAKKDRTVEVNGDDIDCVYPTYFNGCLVAYNLHMKGQKDGDIQVRISESMINNILKKFLKGKKFSAVKAVKYHYIEEGEQP